MNSPLIVHYCLSATVELRVVVEIPLCAITDASLLGYSQLFLVAVCPGVAPHPRVVHGVPTSTSLRIVRVRYLVNNENKQLLHVTISYAGAVFFSFFVCLFVCFIVFVCLFVVEVGGFCVWVWVFLFLLLGCLHFVCFCRLFSLLSLLLLFVFVCVGGGRVVGGGLGVFLFVCVYVFVSMFFNMFIV